MALSLRSSLAVIFTAAVLVGCGGGSAGGELLDEEGALSLGSAVDVNDVVDVDDVVDVNDTVIEVDGLGNAVGSIAELLSRQEDFSEFYYKVRATHWLKELGNRDRYWTVLALDNISMENIEASEKFILEDHIVEEMSTLIEPVESGVKQAVSGAELTFATDNTRYSVNGTTIVSPSLLSANNGLIQEIQYPATWEGGTGETLPERLDRLIVERGNTYSDSNDGQLFFQALIQATDSEELFSQPDSPLSLIIPVYGVTETEWDEQWVDKTTMYDYFIDNQETLGAEGAIQAIFSNMDAARKFLLAHTLPGSISELDIRTHSDSDFESLAGDTLNIGWGDVVSLIPGASEGPELYLDDSLYFSQVGIAQTGFIHQILHALSVTPPFAERIPKVEPYPVQAAALQAGNINNYLIDFEIAFSLGPLDDLEWTVFAPNDAVYTEIGGDSDAVINYISTNGALTPSELLAIGTLKMAQGTSVTITGTVDELDINGHRATLITEGPVALYSIDGLF